MKPTAIVINTARGTIIDQEALIDAIQQGEIAGAGLDVTDPEPAPPTNPIFGLDRVIVTPHCSGATTEAMIRMVMDAVMGIDEVLNGKEPTYKVV
jgi:D-3-phosphoglycerate dehydrogenase